MSAVCQECISIQWWYTKTEENTDNSAAHIACFILKPCLKWHWMLLTEREWHNRCVYLIPCLHKLAVRNLETDDVPNNSWHVILIKALLNHEDLPLYGCQPNCNNDIWFNLIYLIHLLLLLLICNSPGWNKIKNDWWTLKLKRLKAQRNLCSCCSLCKGIFEALEYVILSKFPAIF